MRKYGRVETGFWQNKKIRRLPEDARTFAFYLMTCPHGNAAGCFVLPLPYACSDLGWTEERTTEALAAVVAGGIAEHDADADMVRLIGWWGHNPIENPNVAKHIVGALLALPKSPLRSAAIAELKGLLGLSDKVAEAIRMGLQRVPETLPDGFRNKEPNLTEPEPEPEPAQARGGGGKVYAFTGRIIRLTPADFETWRKAYHAIPDMTAELTAIDAKFQADPPKDWFGTASSWLRTKHEKCLRERAPPPEQRTGSRRTMN